MEIFGVAAVGFLGLVVYVTTSRFRQGRRQRDWPSAEGVVTESADYRPVGSRSTFHVRVRFRTRDGREVHAWAANHVDVTPTRDQGTPAIVSYDPSQPERFYVRLPGMTKASPWALLGAAGVVAFVVLVLYLVLFA